MDTISKNRKVDGPSLDVIFDTISAARVDNSDFSIPHQTKKLLCDTYSVPAVVQCTLDAIRKTQTPVIDETNWVQDIASLISRVETESRKMSNIKVAWQYRIGKESVVFQAQDSILLSCSTVAGTLSTYLSGPERYRQSVSNAPTPAENWANDMVLTKVLTNNLQNPKNSKEALSRNRLRVGCMQVYGCQYPTSFPVSAMVWILRREASMRPNGKLFRMIDPCAGWGDRLAGAMIAGSTIVEHYLGIDPWTVSNKLCENIRAKFSSSSQVHVDILSARAEEEGRAWPDCDLVFTSPPYAKLECYGVKDGAADDGQAWRLCESGSFATAFLAPLLRNAARCTRALNGRIIINIGNTKPKHGGDRLTVQLVEEATRAGLVLVETFGMRLSVRAPESTFSHGSDIVRAEPFFVFRHPQ
jgi:hypothetical protein